MRQKQGFSIRLKIPLSIFLVISLTLSITIFIILNHTENVLNAVKDNRLEERALVVGEAITSQIQRAGKDLTMLASLPHVLETIEAEGYSAGTHAASAIFTRMRMICGYYDSLYLYAENGQVLAGSPGPLSSVHPATTHRWFVDAMRKSSLVTSHVRLNPKSKSALLPVSLKLVYNGRAAVVNGMLQLDMITRDALRRVATSDITPLIVSGSGQERVNLGKSIPGLMEAFTLAGSLPPGSGSTTLDISHQRKRVGYCQIPNSDLYALVIAEPAYMLANLTAMQQVTLAAGIAATVAAMFCVWLLLFPLIRDINKLSLFATTVTSTGQPNQRISLHRDDELGQLARSLNIMVERLVHMVQQSKSATKAKSDFLARMSHEIRTPMNGIIGMTYLALTHNPEPSLRHYLMRIDRAAKTLLGVINDILDFSKVEAGKMALSLEPFRLSSLLEDVRDLLIIKSQEKELDFQVQCDADVPDALIGDSLRITQVCINLCNNALKFTEKGEVRLRVSLQNKDVRGLKLLFRISDTGVGMDPETQRRVFEPFVQAPNASQQEGTGLGLSISRLLVELMGGHISVESTPDKGSTFSFTVPLQEDFVPAEAEKNTSSQIKPLPPLSVLLVEDNDLNREIAEEILTILGADCTTAANGVEALSLWERGDFDLILMDIEMPLMDGLSAARRIRASDRPRAACVPIIAMTAHAMAEDKDRCLGAGMNEHITKPLDPKLLRQALAYWGAVAKEPQEEVQP